MSVLGTIYVEGHPVVDHTYMEASASNIVQFLVTSRVRSGNYDKVVVTNAAGAFVYAGVLLITKDYESMHFIKCDRSRVPD